MKKTSAPVAAAACDAGHSPFRGLRVGAAGAALEAHGGRHDGAGAVVAVAGVRHPDPLLRALVVALDPALLVATLVALGDAAVAVLVRAAALGDLHRLV